MRGMARSRWKRADATGGHGRSLLGDRRASWPVLSRALEPPWPSAKTAEVEVF